MIDNLKQLKLLNDQVDKLISHLQGDISLQFPKYNKICNDLFHALSHKFPNCKVYPFGSTTTGLCFKNSDLDVYISGIRHQYFNETKCLYILKDLLGRYNSFTNLFVISHAKIPILKCVHIGTGINCDINLRNMLGVCNSNLIKYYIDKSSKIKMLLIILKCWARKHNMTGQSHLFTNYSICLLVIFLLQQQPYGAPSVFELQKNRQSHNYQECWNGGFTSVTFFSSALANTTLLRLLNHFFIFYSEFDYGTDIICPYLGRTVKKDEFKTPETLPNCYRAYKAYIKDGRNPVFKYPSVICIQDPFEHCRNTVSVVTESVLQAFIKFCNLGKELCKNGESGLIYKLFTESPLDINMKSNSKRVDSHFHIQQDTNLKFIKQQVKDNDPNRNDTINTRWFEHVHEFLLVVLKDFLQFDLEEVQSTSHKIMKGASQSDVYDKDQSKYKYKCSAKLNLWQARKQSLQDIDKSKIKDLGLMEKEKVITGHLCNKYKHIKMHTYIMVIEICIELKSDPTRVVIFLKDVSSYKKMFGCFASFFYPNFKNWLTVYEKELTESCK